MGQALSMHSDLTRRLSFGLDRQEPATVRQEAGPMFRLQHNLSISRAEVTASKRLLDVRLACALCHSLPDIPRVNLLRLDHKYNIWSVRSPDSLWNRGGRKTAWQPKSLGMACLDWTSSHPSDPDLFKDKVYRLVYAIDPTFGSGQ